MRQLSGIWGSNRVVDTAHTVAEKWLQVEWFVLPLVQSCVFSLALYPPIVQMLTSSHSITIHTLSCCALQHSFLSIISHIFGERLYHSTANVWLFSHFYSSVFTPPPSCFPYLSVSGYYHLIMKVYGFSIDTIALIQSSWAVCKHLRFGSFCFPTSDFFQHHCAKNA